MNRQGRFHLGRWVGNPLLEMIDERPGTHKDKNDQPCRNRGRGKRSAKYLVAHCDSQKKARLGYRAGKGNPWDRLPRRGLRAALRSGNGMEREAPRPWMYRQGRFAFPVSEGPSAARHSPSVASLAFISAMRPDGIKARSRTAATGGKALMNCVAYPERA